jgi:hypothetical protein
MTAIEDRHARFLTSIRPRLDDLAPLMVSEHGRGFWAVLDPPSDGVDSRIGFMPEGPGLAALESRELAELMAELLARYDPAYVPPPDLPGPFDPTRDPPAGDLRSRLRLPVPAGRHAERDQAPVDGHPPRLSGQARAGPGRRRPRLKIELVRVP